MSQLGRLEFIVQDTLGNAVSGASVEVRRQGATIDGAQSGTPLNVNAPNGILVGDTVVRNATTSPTKVVSAITATTVSLGAGGFVNVSDDDRLSIALSLPTLYNDSEAAEVLANPLATDANGYASCWIANGKYDALISGGGVTTTLRQDLISGGGESYLSNAYNTGSNTVWQLDTLRTMVTNDKLVRFANAGSEILNVKAAGVNITGAATVSSTLGVTGATTLTGGIATSTAVTGTLTASTGLVATTGNVQATAGDVIGRRLIATKGTGVIAGDFALGAAWGSTATVSTVLSGSRDTRGAIRITANGAGIAANPTVTLTFKDGTFPGGESPFAVAVCGTGNTVLAAGDFWYAAATLTQGVFWYGGTPTAGRVYELSYHVIG